VMNADGSNLIRLSGSGERRPSWSADGKQMVYCSPSQQKIAGGNPIEIFVSNADGSNARMLTNDTIRKMEPSWSPDSSKIIFIKSTAEVPRKTSLFLLNADGTELRRLTSASSEDHCPKWSPDGQKIAFQSNRDGNWEIYVLTVE